MKKTLCCFVALFCAMGLWTGCEKNTQFLGGGEEGDAAYREQEADEEASHAVRMELIAQFAQATLTSASLEGQVVVADSAQLRGREVGILVSECPNPHFDNGRKLVPTSVGADGGFSVTARNLFPSTTYYFRPYVCLDERKVVVGEVLAFSTLEFVGIDLGLGVKWSNVNLMDGEWEEMDLDAYGDCYAWGETTPKSAYDWTSYQFGASPSAYHSVHLASADDAAHVALGGNWRIPTAEECRELVATRSNPGYRWAWKQVGAHVGWEVVCLANGNSIFLPAAGHRFGDSSYGEGAMGFYWTSSRGENSSGEYAFRLYFEAEEVYVTQGERCCGYSVRPVATE